MWVTVGAGAFVCVGGWVGARVCVCACVRVCVCMCVVGRRRGDVGVRVVEQERERQTEGDKIGGCRYVSGKVIGCL